MPDSDSESSVDPDPPHLSPGCVIDYYAGISVFGDQRWLTRGVIHEISGCGEEIPVTMDTGEVMGYMKQAPNPNVSVVDNIRQGIRASLRHSGLSQFQDFLDSPAQSNNTQTSDDDSSSDDTHTEPSANTQDQYVQKSDDSSSSDNSNVETNPQFEQQRIPSVARQAQVRFDASLLSSQQLCIPDDVLKEMVEAFKDYFQMGESTAALCVSHLCRGIVNCPGIADVYLRTPTKDDAKRIERLHHETHGIRGMLGSLDVTKVVWENCPAALKGQYQGKEKVATIGLEAVADHNLWIWHRAFGFPGTLNDINIWERSPLFQSMQDGSHSEIDFEFLINGETFTKLYYLVDGIYPTLARFLSTISDPTSKIASFFAVNQEAFRKDVERAFGVLKKKFLALKHPILYHHQDDIFFVVFASIAMHNMMVNYRIEEEGVLESEHFYAVSHLEDTELANQTDEQEELRT
eukprot:scaffold248515_cov72-Cyclotella_meneghiniana.AAC.2